MTNLARRQAMGAVALCYTLLACHGDRRQAELDELQQQVESLLEETGLPGISVAVVEQGGAILSAAAGYADVERSTPLRPESRFFTGSVAKNIYATIALMLVEQDRLSLDDRLSAYVDWPRGSEITIRMLLNHTSGIPEYMAGPLFASRAGDAPEFTKSPHSPGDVLRTMPTRSLMFEPGTEQRYSNTNGLLVGEMLEAITDSTLGESLQAYIVTPLQLESMYLYEEGRVDDVRARGYCDGAQWGGVAGEQLDCSFADEALPNSADGSVISSAADLLRYHMALRDGRLLGDAEWQQMRTVEPGLSNGLGYLVGEGPFGRYEGSVGRSIGHVAASIYYVDRDIYVVMMMNRGDAPLPLPQFLELRYGVM